MGYATDPTLLQVVRVLNIVWGILIIVLGLLLFQFLKFLTIQEIMWRLYLVLFGVLICLSEVGTRCILQYFNFLSHLPGKGWFLLFVGSFLIWDVAYWGFYVGIGCAVCGLIYIIISCQALQAICQHIFCHGYKYEKVDNP
eukprot:TRINITY_DN1980_c0_g1_i1.p2 TRINITY_DN1980_c0_g1~~TRINITY_DN1980_c0_g1_i1.p2  ORF type:complete len:141 (+),score=29.73 TRINITY_DN1980_c0_g1_i1:179-601(+)